MAELLIDLLNRCRQGDRDAFKIVIQRFQPKALDLARGLVNDDHLAEDVVQEAFIKVFCRLDQLRDPAAFVGWFRQIIRSEAVRIIRKDCNKSNEKLCQNEMVSPYDEAALKELQQMVRGALAELSKENQQTAKLFYLDEFSCQQVAQTLNVPLGTVKRRLHDIREKLRSTLESYAGQSPSKKKTSKKTDNQLPL